MSTTVLLGLTSFEKIRGQWILGGGGSNFSNLLATWASGSRSLMLRAVCTHFLSPVQMEPKSLIIHKNRHRCTLYQTKTGTTKMNTFMENTADELMNLITNDF